MGALKIGQQFLNGHKHHSEKELKISRYKGIELKQYSFSNKFEHPSFKGFMNEGKKEQPIKDQRMEVLS